MVSSHVKENETKVGKECTIGVVYCFRQEIYGVPISRFILKVKALAMYQKNLKINVHLYLH